MKIIKGIFLFILHSVLTLIILLFVFSCGAKPFLNDVIYEGMKQEVIKDKIYIESDKFNKILEYEESKVIVDDVIEDIISLDDNSIDVEDKIITFVKDNRELIEKEYDVQLSDEDIYSLERELSESNINEEYVKIKNDFNRSITEDEKFIINIYNFIVSDQFKIILGIISIVCLLLISVIKKSYYSWIVSLGISSIIAGVVGSVFGIFGDYLISTEILKNVDISLGIISKYYISLIIGGIICIVVYFMIKKLVKSSKELENEVSEVFE